jgi:hypothetical protein
VVLTILLLDPPKVLPAALAWAGKAPGTCRATPNSPPDPLGADTSNDGWARPAGQTDVPPDIKALA